MSRSPCEVSALQLISYDIDRATRQDAGNSIQLSGDAAQIGEKAVDRNQGGNAGKQRQKRIEGDRRRIRQNAIFGDAFVDPQEYVFHPCAGFQKGSSRMGERSSRSQTAQRFDPFIFLAQRFRSRSTHRISRVAVPPPFPRACQPPFPMLRIGGGVPCPQARAKFIFAWRHVGAPPAASRPDFPMPD